MNKQTFDTTKQVITHCLKFIHGKTLDLGAGTGKYKGMIKPYTSEYIALDLEEGENIDIVADITQTGLDSNSLDTVISTQVFEHIPKPWEAVREVHRILKPGGKCIVTAPFVHAYHADPHDYYRYTVEGIKALFSEGFVVVEAGPYTRLMTTFSDMIRHSFLSPYKKKWRGKARLESILNKIAHFLDKPLKIGNIYGGVYIVAEKK